ncbi:hypothetical protein [Inquilinus limosus]|uniref:hypothetical protein n=1 Tax=Inquilinus limosus TaxID=171674 RepID=UPI000410055E|nr:hypothetical protein [Inquilinus limosus]
MFGRRKSDPKYRIVRYKEGFCVQRSLGRFFGEIEWHTVEYRSTLASAQQALDEHVRHRALRAQWDRLNDGRGLLYDEHGRPIN